MFSLIRYEHEQYEQYLNEDGSGLSFFAKDDDWYYGYAIPTDVRFFPGGGDDAERRAAWDFLKEQVGPSIRDDFITRNNLTPYNNEKVVSPLQNQLMSYLSELFTEVYESYYEGLHYEISNYEETVIDGEYTATFYWTMYHLDNGIDVPSDLGKEQEANWSLQATIQLTDDGQLDTTTAVVLGDNRVTGPPTYQVPIKDYFPNS